MVARTYPAPPRLNHGERLATLEERHDTVEQRHDDMNKLLTEIHQLLTGAKAIAWACTKIGGGIGLRCTVIGARVALWKRFSRPNSCPGVGLSPRPGLPSACAPAACLFAFRH